MGLMGDPEQTGDVCKFRGPNASQFVASKKTSETHHPARSSFVFNFSGTPPRWVDRRMLSSRLV
jgi:hypothetical protein